MIWRCVLAALLLCSSSTLSAAEDARPCRITGYSYEILCGELLVPADPQQPQLGTIKVAWRKIAARARYPRPDPLIWIPDGIGSDASEYAPGLSATLTRVLNTRDLIWLDTRGSGASSPLQCAPPGPASISKRLERFSDARTLAACQQAILAAGGLAAYTPQRMAADHEQLRQRLGLKQVNVLAEGTGVEVAKAWVRIQPHAINKMVWESPLPADDPLAFQASYSADALAQLLVSCEQNLRCNAAYPNLNSRLEQILRQLPVSLTLPHPQTGHLDNFILDERMLASLLTSILRSTSLSSALPAALEQAANGHWLALLGLSSSLWSRDDTRFNHGLWLARQCQWLTQRQGAPSSVWGQWFHQHKVSSLQAYCADLPFLTTSNGATVDLDGIPTLVLAARYTDATLADRVMRHVIKVPGVAQHVLSHGCARDVIYRFMAADGMPEKASLEAECLLRIKAPAPGQVSAPLQVLPAAKEVRPCVMPVC